MLRPLLLTLLLLAPLQARAQDVTLQLSCDLNGMAVPMLMAVEYLNSFDYSTTPGGDISGVFPVGTEIHTAGEIQGPGVRYIFTGVNEFADVTEFPSMTRFRVRWVLDGANNGVWMIVNPFGPGPTRHFCAFRSLM